MDIMAKLVLVLHLLSLVMASGAGMASARIAGQLGGATQEQRSALFDALLQAKKAGNIGLGLLWVTGVVLVVTRGWDIMSMPLMFWVKIALVVALSATLGINGSATRKMVAGDASAGAKAAAMGKASSVLGVLVVVAAVFTFNP